MEVQRASFGWWIALGVGILAVVLAVVGKMDPLTAGLFVALAVARLT